MRLLYIVAIAMLFSSLNADPPEWWEQGPLPILDSSSQPANFSPANLGQAKHATYCALETLRIVVPSLADEISADLQPIVDFSIPSPLPSDWHDRHHAPLNVGQLKALSTPFYLKIDTYKSGNASSWLANQLILNQVTSDGIFPWTATTSADDNNYGIANIGQLKTVFSLRFNKDGDSDGLSDFAETVYFGGLSRDGNGDQDGDSLSDRFEMLNQLDPSDTDSDNDGTLDGAEDLDNDGALSISELISGSNPNSKDHPAVKLGVVVTG